jgi:hypothetical protein
MKNSKKLLTVAIILLNALALNAFELKVTDSSGKPVTGAHVVMVNKNTEYVLESSSNSLGVATFESSGGDDFVLMCAHPQYKGYYDNNFDPFRKKEIQFSSSKSSGSTIIVQGTGYINGFNGRLNPILDRYERTYLYATNISVEGGSEADQPYHFKIGKNFEMVDRAGNEIEISIDSMIGRTSLIQHPVLSTQVANVKTSAGSNPYSHRDSIDYQNSHLNIAEIQSTDSPSNFVISPDEDVIITSADGREMEVNILEFREDSILVSRTSDERQLEVKHNMLSPDDKDKMSRMYDLVTKYPDVKVSDRMGVRKHYGQSEFIIRDLQSLFSKYCRSSDSVKNPMRDVMFDLGIRYLMTRKDCEEVLNLGQSVKRRLDTPGIPASSFVYYVYTDPSLPRTTIHADSFMLITDLNDCVVGYQFVNRTRPSRDLIERGDYKIYDIIQNIRKATSGVSITYEVTNSGDIINLHSYAKKEDGANVQETYLTLHKQIGDLILYNIQESWIKR